MQQDGPLLQRVPQQNGHSALDGSSGEQFVKTIELVLMTVESVRDSKSERMSLLTDTIVRVKL